MKYYWQDKLFMEKLKYHEPNKYFMNSIKYFVKGEYFMFSTTLKTVWHTLTVKKGQERDLKDLSAWPSVGILETFRDFWRYDEVLWTKQVFHGKDKYFMDKMEYLMQISRPKDRKFS